MAVPVTAVGSSHEPPYSSSAPRARVGSLINQQPISSLSTLESDSCCQHHGNQHASEPTQVTPQLEADHVLWGHPKGMYWEIGIMPG